MAFKIYKDGNYVIIEDADGKVIFNSSTARLAQKKRGQVKIYSQEQLLENYQTVTAHVDDFVGADGLALPGGTLAWLRLNTGFKPASGGSGAGDGELTQSDIVTALGYTPLATETDPNVPLYVKNLTQEQISKLSEVDNKVDKVEGKGLSDQNYTLGEKEKLAGLESSKFKGTYLSLEALQTAHPTPEEGSYAHVDAGAGQKVVYYIWDANDSVWEVQQGESTEETAASIKSKYESNPDTNAFTDTEKTKLEGVQSGANNYTHPETHSPSIISQDANNRFVTDLEKETWNGKQDAKESKEVTATSEYIVKAEDWGKNLVVTANNNEDINIVFNDGVIPDTNSCLSIISVGEHKLFFVKGTGQNTNLTPTKGNKLNTVGKGSVVSVSAGLLVTDLFFSGTLEYDMVDENRGYLDPQLSSGVITIPHGLTFEPSYINFIFSETGNGLNDYSVAVDATNITITFNAVPTISTVRVYWEAKN